MIKGLYKKEVHISAGGGGVLENLDTHTKMVQKYWTEGGGSMNIDLLRESFSYRPFKGNKL